MWPGCFERWAQPHEDPRDGQYRRAIQVIAQRCAEVPQAPGAMLRNVVVVVPLLLTISARRRMVTRSLRRCPEPVGMVMVRRNEPLRACMLNLVVGPEWLFD